MNIKNYNNDTSHNMFKLKYRSRKVLKYKSPLWLCYGTSSVVKNKVKILTFLKNCMYWTVFLISVTHLVLGITISLGYQFEIELNASSLSLTHQHTTLGKRDLSSQISTCGCYYLGTSDLNDWHLSRLAGNPTLTDTFETATRQTKIILYI